MAQVGGCFALALIHEPLRAREHTQHLISLSSALGVLQNDTAPMIGDHAPFFDLLQRSKAAEAGKIVVQAAIPDARGLSRVVDITH
jgi:hypothetical protein